MTELNLWLDSYDDIYSDFDSRHYLKRKVSEDFLYELRREMKDAEHHSRSLVLLLPSQKRDVESEKFISKCLVDFFHEQFRFHQDKYRKKLRSGILILIGGIAIMLFNVWLTFQFNPSDVLTYIRILLEPAGWFLIWAAFDFLFYGLATIKREKNFYSKMSHMHVCFKSA